jgi:hypothetical protein
METPMSQNELHQLLYAALASGSTDSHDQTNPEKTSRQDDFQLSTDCTPQEIIAHYDFRARSQHTFAE